MPWRPKPRIQKPRGREPHSKSTTERGYGWDWQVFREQILTERPICEDQERNHRDQVRPSIEVHHIRKIKHRPDLRLEPSNVLALCEECHDRRTVRGE